MRSMSRCGWGHFFDSSRHRTCPSCAQLDSALPLGQKSTCRVFISSTSIDLQDYREATFKAIQSLGGYSDDMVFWSADERSGATFSVDRVRQSDVLILLLAHRYGHVPDGSAYSVTEMEYRTARTTGIPVLAFVVDDDVPWPPKFIEHERASELARFKELVGKEVTRRVFHSPDELMALVTQSLVSLATRLPKNRSRGGRSFRGSAGIVFPPAMLRSTPDAAVLVGSAEDGLPLVLRVNRSQDVGSLLKQIVDTVARPGAEPPEAMFRTFQQSLEQYSRQAWAQERVFWVSGRDGCRSRHVRDVLDTDDVVPTAVWRHPRGWRAASAD